MATAFISHASQDREVAERICSFLEERGITCWIAPRDVRPGRKYGEEIVDGIQRADAVVLVLTENANTSTFVEREIERAVSYGKPTLPVRVREVQPSRSLELFISSAHWIDAWKPPMEQYLDRLADSIRTLAPLGAGLGETTFTESRRTKPTPPKRNASVVKRIGIGAIIVCLLGAGAAVTWWLLVRKMPTSSTPGIVSSTPAATVGMTAAPPIIKKRSARKMETTPAPTVVASKRVAIPAATPLEKIASASAAPSPSASPTGREEISGEPVNVPSVRGENDPTVREILVTIGDTHGNQRFQAIKDNVQKLPPKITIEAALAITKDTTYRNEAIEMLVSRLPNPMPVKDLLRILGTTTSHERLGLIKMFAQHVPDKISTEELLGIINGSSYRNEAIGLLSSRLPSPLPVADLLRILQPTTSHERQELIKMQVQRLPSSIMIDDLLAILGSTSYRSETIGLLLSRLPSPLPVESLLQILDSTTSHERQGLIQMFVQRLPDHVSVDEMLGLTNGTSYRNDTIKLFMTRLPDPIPVEDLSRILGSTTSNERYGLIQILAPRVPAGLSADQVERLTQGSAYPQEAKKLLTH